MTATINPGKFPANPANTGTTLHLRDIVKSIPRQYFQKNAVKAWTQVAITLVSVTLSYVALAYSPWFLLPFAWFLTGTALTGFFVIGHDCGHRSFAKRKWVNDVVGHLAFLPLLYPFHSWRFLHDKHHNHTNKMDVDNAWQPLRPELYEASDIVRKVGYKLVRGNFWWIGSVFHWALIHFDLSNYHPRDRAKANFSNWFVIAAGLIFLPLLTYYLGPWALVKFWIMPWLGYHFWMSTFTIVHHTLPEIEFQEPHVWDAAKAQLFGTVHCEYPAGIEFLCHHINVHIPHHVSVAIPSYNLRAVHNHLKSIWGDDMVIRNFDLKLVKQITQECHLYHEDRFYQSFNEFDSTKG